MIPYLRAGGPKSRRMAGVRWLLCGMPPALILLGTVAPILLASMRAGRGSSDKDTSPNANTNPVYKQLRAITPGGKAVSVKDFVMKRDAGTFTFKSGVFVFLSPVEGKTTGAVFIGSGTFSLFPPLEAEKRSLKLLTKSDEMAEQFSKAVFRFTDGTEEEIEAKGVASTELTTSQAGEILADIQKTLRKNLQYNLEGRILADVLGSQPGYFFCAFIKGEKYSGKEIYVMDPHGIPGDFLGGVDVAPEEVAFSSYDDNKHGIWAAFHYSDEYAEGAASGRQVNESYG